MAMRALTIGVVAQQAGVSVETVRFYERQGLIQTPTRPQSGFRQYTQDTVTRLQFIRRAKELGFTLRETSELLEIRVNPNATCGHVKELAQAKLIDVEAKIRDLQDIKTALNCVIDPCLGRGPLSECPILEALDAEKNFSGEHVGNSGIVGPIERNSVARTLS